jgi:hypothetical protein
MAKGTAKIAIQFIATVPKAKSKVAAPITTST